MSPPNNFFILKTSAAFGPLQQLSPPGNLFTMKASAAFGHLQQLSPPNNLFTTLKEISIIGHLKYFHRNTDIDYYSSVDHLIYMLR